MGKVKEHNRIRRKKPASGNQPQIEPLTPVSKSIDNGNAVRGEPEFALMAADAILDYIREHILQYYSWQKPAPS